MPSSTESIAERRSESQIIDAPLPVSDMMSSCVPLATTFEELLGTGDAPGETADEPFSIPDWKSGPVESKCPPARTED